MRALFDHSEANTDAGRQCEVLTSLGGYDCQNSRLGPKKLRMKVEPQVFRMLRANFNLSLKPAGGDSNIARDCSWRAMFVLLTLFLAGCAASVHQQRPSTIQPVIPGAALSPRDIDVRVCGFADTFITRVAEPYNQIIANAKTPEERAWALQSRLGQGLAALTDATGPNPHVNLLDIVVLVSLERMSIEDHWIPNLLHDDGKDLLAAYKQSEKEVWEMAGLLFTDQQVADLKNLIAKWKQENPTFYYTGFVRFTDFISNAPASKNSPILPSSLLGLLNIDPLAGLDPVTEEAERFRMLSERLVFVGMRAPIIMNWQIEAAADRIMMNPEIQSVVSTSAQYAKVGDRFNDIVAKYPSDYSQATKGAIDQINAAATQQRQAIIQELNSESDQVHGILADARNSIVVARDATASMNANTAQTIFAAESSSRRILRDAQIVAITLIIIGFLWPAIVIFGYRYATLRWLRARDPTKFPE
jgi:hypothetical protein